MTEDTTFPTHIHRRVQLLQMNERILWVPSIFQEKVAEVAKCRHVVIGSLHSETVSASFLQPVTSEIGIQVSDDCKPTPFDDRQHSRCRYLHMLRRIVTRLQMACEVLDVLSQWTISMVSILIGHAPLFPVENLSQQNLGITFIRHAQ
ncbi:MAG: hypothetical protein O2983_07360 [Planctomycetota bacterium]|nr:hypothetical protein [Planctomycetota bacterium]MDA0921956.1 hypothetical protein [Planctomycetota bacterium]MDA1159412.1 hypothetical protein [Planctomycetota bacterium]